MAITIPYEEYARMMARRMPECFVCPDCGPFVWVDEDGCCVTCGADTRLESVLLIQELDDG